MKNQLEDLPNELLWLILEYIPSIDLFVAFFNLNQRMNTILRSIHFHLNLQYINKSQYDYYLHTILPNIESNWIISLRLDDITNHLESIKTSKYLRSLTIHHLRTESIDYLAKEILPDLKQLKYLSLHSEYLLKDDDIKSLSKVIFNNEMSSLTYCYLAFQDFGCMNFNHLDRGKQNLSLKTLILDQWCRLNDFIQLLHFIPNIRRLTVRLSYINPKGVIIPSLMAINDFSVLVPHLIYLRAKLSQISFVTATKILFLRLPTQLRELSLSTWSIEYTDGDQWQTILSSRFPHLQHFRLIISLDRIPLNHPIATNTDLDNIVKSFNQSKYFLDRHWNVLININERDRLKFVLHTIPYPIENFQTTLYNIRRCTSSSSMIQSAYTNVTKLTLTLHDNLSSVIDNSNEYRNFSRVEELTFLSNLSNDCQQFFSNDYFQNLQTIVNLSTITSLSFPEETHQYPLQLINLLLKNLIQLHSLTLSHRLYVCLKPQLISSLKMLTLIFTIYSSISPSATSIRHLLPANLILTNDSIIELVETLATTNLQTLTLLVRELGVFDEQFSDWLENHFTKKENISYDLLLNDKIVRFHF
ncbi:hypothetical protein I4U23_029887 [Adineta vaga]|nr:hypothetical protein I4U23_029887 [Adineta vaga]